MSINGTVKSYIAGNTITKGDFVQYSFKSSTAIELYSASQQIYAMNCIFLSANKIFLCFQDNSSHLGVIGTISNDTITLGTVTTLYNDYGGGNLAATCLNENTIFIACSATRNYNYLYGIVCTISGTTITTGTLTQLNTTASSGTQLQAITLSSNQVFITYRNGCKICTISGTSVTSTTTKTMDTVQKIVQLSLTKIFMLYDNDNNLYGKICTISGTSITISAACQLTNFTNIYSYKTESMGTYTTEYLSENNIFIAYYHIIEDDSNLYYIYGMKCTIDNTNITVNCDILVESVEDTVWKPLAELSAISLSENTILLVKGSYATLYHIINNTIIANASIETVTLSWGRYVKEYTANARNGNMIVTLQPCNYSGSDLVGRIQKFYVTCNDNNISDLNRVSGIIGIAASNATTNNAVQVYEP